MMKLMSHVKPGGKHKDAGAGKGDVRPPEPPKAGSDIPEVIKRVYMFKDGNKDMKNILGGKGANLCEMTRLGLPVPPGFIISTKVCKEFFDTGTNELPEGLEEEYMKAMAHLEEAMGKKFGDVDTPLLLSVRSGAPVSMPGMMDTVLNLGVNDATVAKMAEKSGNPRWAYDVHRRFLQMFSNVVMGVDGGAFEEAISAVKKAKGVKTDNELDADDLKEIVRRFKEINKDVPDDPVRQLYMSVRAVFSSWFNARAVRYRAYNNIPKDLGTAVNVQVMVFGNMNDDSGTGVAFTRNPANGENKFFGEFLENAEGEDVVAGIRTPKPLEALEAMWPKVYDELWGYQEMLEKHYRDMQDLEFTIENGKLYMLQCRNGKRTPKAAVKMAVDMVEEGMITEKEGLKRIPAKQMDFFLHPSIDPDAEKTVIGKGLPASPGAATGSIVMTPEDAQAQAKEGKSVILVRRETTPEDIHGMKAAVGILTQLGGMTSHAAVVARGMGTSCVSGCGDIHVDVEAREVHVRDGRVLKEGDVVTLDGLEGEVLLGEVKRVPAGEDADFEKVLAWADHHRRLKVKANADTPEDARTARRWGAQGIGLCRTEHMFFAPERINVMRAMILAETLEEREKHLEKLFEFQRDDMKGLFKEMDGLPVTIRMLDPPLHEFLPSGDEACQHLAEAVGMPVEAVNARVEHLQEVNPMLGFRGCRLTVVHPEITRMQARAMVTAAVECKKAGIDPKPEIMIPVVSSSRELAHILPIVTEVMDKVFEEQGEKVHLKLGTMMELPRACMRADTMAAQGIEFMSFGTNDLTQTTWGFSRDDMPKYVPAYIDNEVLEMDPFVTIDVDGVGGLIDIAMEKTKEVNPNMEMGICGEHGGDAASVTYFHSAGFDYVSCSPFRVPIARIAAAQAAVADGDKAEREAPKGK